MTGHTENKNFDLSVAQGDGSNGHYVGSWEFQIRDEHSSLWFEGGFPPEKLASAAGKKKMKELKKP